MDIDELWFCGMKREMLDKAVENNYSKYIVWDEKDIIWRGNGAHGREMRMIWRDEINKASSVNSQRNNVQIISASDKSFNEIVRMLNNKNESSIKKHGCTCIKKYHNTL